MALGPEFTFAIHRFKVLRQKVANARNIGRVNPQDVKARNDALGEAIALLMKSEQECGSAYPAELIERRKALQQTLEKWQRNE